MATTECPPDAPARLRPVTAIPRAALLGAAVLLFAYAPLLVLHFRQVWLRPHFQFVPFVVLGAAVLAAVRLRDQGAEWGTAGRGAYALAAVAWALLAAAELLYSSWLGAVAALTVLSAAVLGVGGTPLLRRLAPCVALLALAVPPPFELDRQLILGLQQLTTLWASRVLDYLGVLHVRAGNVIEVSGQRLLVEEACSGVNSLLPVLACTLFFVFLVRRPFVRGALLVATALAWALAANMVRVVGIACLSVFWGVDLTTGLRHEAVGGVLFVAVLALIVSTDKLLEFLSRPGTGTPSARQEPEAAVAPPHDFRPSRRPWFAAWPVALAFLLLGVFHLWAYAGVAPREWPAADVAIDSLNEDALPAQAASWERLSFKSEPHIQGSAFGEMSRVWTYGHGGDGATLSLDYPFPYWHDLTRCYTGQGWVIDEETVHESAAAPDLPGGYVEVKLSQPGYRSGYLLFCQFDGHGQPLTPQRGGAHLSAARHETALRRLWLLAEGKPEAAPPEPVGPVYQFQLFCEGFAPPSPQQQQQAQALFAESWKCLLRRWPE